MSCTEILTTGLFILTLFPTFVGEILYTISKIANKLQLKLFSQFLCAFENVGLDTGQTVMICIDGALNQRQRRPFEILLQSVSTTDRMLLTVGFVPSDSVSFKRDLSSETDFWYSWPRVSAIDRSDFHLPYKNKNKSRSGHNCESKCKFNKILNRRKR